MSGDLRCGRLARSSSTRREEESFEGLLCRGGLVIFETCGAAWKNVPLFA